MPKVKIKSRQVACDLVSIHGLLEVLFCAIQVYVWNKHPFYEKNEYIVFIFGYAKDEGKNVICINLNRTVAFDSSCYWKHS